MSDVSFRKAAQSYLQRKKSLLSQEECEKLLDNEDDIIRNLTHRFKRLLENLSIDAKYVKNDNGNYDIHEETFIAVLEELDNKSSPLYKISTMRGKKLNADELFSVLVSYSREYEASTSDKTAAQLNHIISFLKSIIIFNEQNLINQLKKSIDLYVYGLSDCTPLDRVLYLCDLKKLIDHEVIVNITNMSLATIQVADIIENYRKETGDTECMHLRDSVDENFKKMLTENNLITYANIVNADNDFLDYFKTKFHKTPKEVFLNFQYK